MRRARLPSRGRPAVPAGRRRRRSAAFDLVITPESAGWGTPACGCSPWPPGESIEFDTESDEMIVLPLTGDVDVTIGDDDIRTGRPGKRFHRRHRHRLSADQFRSADQRRPAAPSRCPAPGWTGRCRSATSPPPRSTSRCAAPASHTRQVNNFGMGAGMECVKMLATEVLTPASNWSSYPPHKHDERHDGTETELEEIYYYRFASAAPASAPARRISAEPRPRHHSTVGSCWLSSGEVTHCAVQRYCSRQSSCLGRSRRQRPHAGDL